MISSSSPHQGSPQAVALELFDVRRAALVERVALDLHDTLAADGISFASARESAAAWVEAVAATLAGRYAPSEIAILNRHALRDLDAGVALGGVIAGVSAALSAMATVAAESDPRAVVHVARAAGEVGAEVAGTAARSLEERARMQLKRRGDRSDRFREAAGAVTAAALDTGGALAALVRSAATTLDCDWAAVALREGDGSLAIAAIEGRGAGWAQRWHLDEERGFCARVLSGGQPVTTADGDLIGYVGSDRPAAIVAAPLRGATDVHGVLFAGRDHGAVPDEDDAQLAAALADIGARAIETGRRYQVSLQAAAQVETLAEAVRQATAGADQAALGLVARAVAEATASDVALVRTVDDGVAELVTRAVHARSSALAAEIEGTRCALNDQATADLVAGRELLRGAVTDPTLLKPLSDRLGSFEAAGLPVLVDDRVVGVLLLARAGAPYRSDDLLRARAGVAHAAMLLVLDRARRHASIGAAAARGEIDRLGEAFLAGADEARVGRLLARVVADALHAPRTVLYRGTGPDDLERVAGHGFRRDELAVAPGRALALDAIARGGTLVTGGDGVAVSALAGTPELPVVLTTVVAADDEPIGALQLFFASPAAAAAARHGLASLAHAAGGALGRAAVSRRRDEELRRLSALVSIAANAASSASLEQTLAAVGAHVATIVPSSAVSVFVIDDGRPVLAEPPSATTTAHAAAVATLVRSDVAGPHVVVPDVTTDERLAALAADLTAAGVGSLVVVPLRFREAVIGAVSLVAGAADAFRERDLDTLSRQAAPIALALGSAVLSAHSARLEQELSGALASERTARGELDAQDTVVRAIAEGWDRTRAAAAVARAAADMLGSDAAGVLLVAADGSITVEALHVASPSLADPVRRIVRRVPTFLPAPTLTALRAGTSSIIEGGQLADGGSLLGPLLAPGASAGLIPLRPESELSAILVVVSLDPARPIDVSRLARAERFATQAALAIRG